MSVSNFMPTVSIRKSVPRSSNMIDNGVGQKIDQKVRESRTKLYNRIENDKNKIDNIVSQRIRKIHRLDLIG
ncbi:MAG: hypothetical protein COA79_15035 [Planctomycetota bacterium]|nr:MAG: hypothetical protein COA79_15035 [Planctomycetota bacterium]